MFPPPFLHSVPLRYYICTHEFVGSKSEAVLRQGQLGIAKARAEKRILLL